MRIAAAVMALLAVASAEEIVIGNPGEDHDGHDVTMHLEDYPEEVEWEIIGNSSPSSTTNCKGGPYNDKYGTVHTTCNLAPGRYLLKCIDTYGDGWHGGWLKIGGTKYCQDFTTGHLKTVEFQKHGVPQANPQPQRANPAKVTGTNQSGAHN